MNVASIIADVLIVLVLIFSIYSSAKKGFVNTIVFTVGLIAGLIIPSFIANTMSNWIYGTFIKQSVLDKISEVLANAANTTSEALSSTILNVVPGFVSMGNSGDQINNILSNSAGLNSTEIAQNIDSAVVAPAVTALISLILLIILFTIWMIGVRFLAKSTRAINRIPLIGAVNSVLGGVMGFVKGAVIVLLCIIGVNLLLQFTSDGISWFNTKTIENSYILNWIYSILY